MTNEVTEITRRAIIDGLTLAGQRWAGRLQDDEFLSRLYDLTKLPSTDDRFTNAAGDIWQHCVRNDDWSADWVFSDRRFNLLHAPDAEFLRFLAETAHPIVQPDTELAGSLVSAYNAELIKDGWILAEAKRISGRPIFSPQRVGARTPVFEEPTGWQKVDRQLQEVRARLDEANSEEQFQAVGLLCREALISVAQEVFDAARHPLIDERSPSDTDAKRMLEAFFEAELKGSANEDARRHAKASIQLAVALQHRRTADFRMAALCAEATTSVVNLLAVICGRRGRPL